MSQTPKPDFHREAASNGVDRAAAVKGMTNAATFFFIAQAMKI